MQRMTRGALLQTSCELAPIFIFFVAGKFLPFVTAVWIFLIVTVISSAVGWGAQRHIPMIPLVSGIVTLTAGALTIYLNMADAIIVADTIWYWGLAACIIVGFFRQKHFFEYVFDKTFAITAEGWRKLSWRWLVVLVFAGAANEYVRIMMTPEFWIDFRFTKVIIITLFSLYQFTLARRYRIESESNSWGLRTTH